MGRQGIKTSTVPNFAHRVFVGLAPELPGSLFESLEAAEVPVDPVSFTVQTWPDPRWVAVLDTSQKVGVSLRFVRGISGLELRHQACFFPDTFYLAHATCRLELPPGGSHCSVYELAVFDGLERVDHVGDGFLCAVELVPQLRLGEKQVARIRTMGLAPRPVSGVARMTTYRPEVETRLLAEVSPVETVSWHQEAGPWSSIDQIKRLWYYAEQYVGEVGRPVPRVRLSVNGDEFERRFVVTPEGEGVLARIDACLEEGESRYRCGALPAEGLAALGVFRDHAERHRRTHCSQEYLHTCHQRMLAVLDGFEERGDWTLYPPDLAPGAVAREPGKGWFTWFQEQLRSLPDGPLEVGYPGHRAYMPGMRVSELAVVNAFCYAVTGEGCYADRAIEALGCFAGDHATWGMTTTGNAPLHMGLQTKELVMAYDWVKDRMTVDQQAGILRYFFFLFDWLEHHVNVSGHNDDIMEGCGLAWVASRFAYLPDSRRKLEKVATNLAEALIFVDGDGGWPENPSYNDFVIRHFYFAAEALRCSGIDLYRTYNGRSLEMFAQWVMRVCSPDGRYPLFGDATRRPPGLEMFILAARRYNRPDFLAFSRKAAELTHHAPHPLAVIHYPYDLEPVPPDLPMAEVLPDTGYAVMRSGTDPDAQFFILDYGTHKIGHRHPDKLNFELIAGGRPLVTDTGYGVRGTRNHNCVLVDGQDQLSRVDGRLQDFRHLPGCDFLHVSAETYSGVLHSRRVFYRRPHGYVLVDRLTSDDRHAYEWLLQLDGDVVLEGATCVLAASAGAGLLVALPAGCDASLKEGTIRDGGQESPWSFTPGVEGSLQDRSIQALSVSREGRAVGFQAALVPFRDTASPGALSVLEEREGLMLLSLTLSGSEHYVLVNETGGAVEAGPVASDASLLWVCPAGGYLAAREGSSFAFGGEAWFSGDGQVDAVEFDGAAGRVTALTNRVMEARVHPTSFSAGRDLTLQPGRTVAELVR